MTNKEVIRVLGRMLDEFCNEDSYAPECKDAVDMAIEALKEQPKHSQNTSSKQPDLETLGINTGETCADAISRQDAIDAMTNTIWHYPNECYRNLNEYEFAKGLAELGLKSVPSAQPEIIHCKECKFAHMTYDGDCKYCDVWFPDESKYLDGDYYCASAERKTDE